MLMRRGSDKREEKNRTGRMRKTTGRLGGDRWRGGGVMELRR
jgi:hypothetical protein